MVFVDSSALYAIANREEEPHSRAAEAWRRLLADQAVLSANRKKLSLVDCVSFQVMRETGIRTAFCFDEHFREQGFDVIP